MGAQKVEIIAAMPSLPVISTGPNWASRIEKILPTLKRAGYSGLQVWPHRRITKDIVKRGLSPDAARWLHSAHQTGKVPGLRGKVMGFWVPDSMDSVDDIRAIEDSLPRDVAAVLFPDTVQKSDDISVFNDSNTGTAIRGYQPSPEMWRDFDVRDAEDAIEKMDAIGLPYKILDPAHMFRQAADGTRITDADDQYNYFLASGRVIQYHVPGNRDDLGYRDADTAEHSASDAEIFAKGSLDDAKDTWQGRLTMRTMGGVVLPSVCNDTLSIVPEHMPRYYSSAGEFVDAHAPFNERLQGLAEAVGASVVAPPVLHG